MQDKDDLRDWVHEAALMHLVYTRSYCNISASAASDSSKGLFFARDPQLLDPANVLVDLQDTTRNDTRLQQCEVLDYHWWENNVSKCTINKRDWVLQERLLAPRVIHFGAQQLFWECRQHDACELYPNGLPELYNMQLETNFKALDPAVYARKMAAQGRQEAANLEVAKYHLWGRVVRAYCAAQLTVPTDKLIAISGLAKRMRSVIDDDYVAGMWRRHLAAELLWCVRDQSEADATSSSRPEAYRAPSWSWASVDGEILPGNATDDELLIAITHFHLEHVTSDQTGMVTSGYLELKCHLKPFKFVKKQIGHLQYWQMQVQGEMVLRNSDLPEWQRLGPTVYLDVSQETFDAENGSQFIYYVMAHKTDFILYDKILYALLLRVVDKDAGVFQRIGLRFRSTRERWTCWMSRLKMKLQCRA